MKKIIVLTVLLLCGFYFIPEASGQKIKSMKNIEWLAGNWTMETKKGNIYENWKLIDDNKMEGISYKVFKKDTTMRETMELILENGDIFYIATVKDQNNGEPVRFKMTDGNRRHMEFENREHDFPQMIKYTWKQNDRFEVEIFGLIKGKKKTMLYEFKN
jgi:Domain of unknown function (DUF6265)